MIYKNGEAMNVKVQKMEEGVKASLRAPPSKSYTHRALIVAGLAEGESDIREYLRAGDTTATIKALTAFGIEIEPKKGKILITGSGGHLKRPSKAIDCANSGTTLRLISGVAALDSRVTLTGDSSLQKRPMQPLLDALCPLGVKAYSTKGDGTPPVVVEGRGMKGGIARIRGDVSSQFISALLISAPYAKEAVSIELTSPLKSKPYVDITIDVMEAFGVRVENRNYEVFEVLKGRYKSRHYVVEGDYSSAGYFLALAALTSSEISVVNLQRESKQGDRRILDILRDMGAYVRAGEKIVVKGDTLQGIEIDLGDTPDLLPTVVALACKASGETVIKNVEHARYKETDRLSACAGEFQKFGVSIEEKRDALVIQGKTRLKGADVDSRGDHRMAMALAIAGLAAEGTTTIKNAECADISFPGFYDVLQSLKEDGDGKEVVGE